MPTLTRPDGTRIHWEERGSGPLVVLASHFFAYPEAFDDLIADLTADHRVITYDTRGTGKSTREGPYDVPTDAADLGALIEEAGGPAVVIGMGDGANRGVKLAVARPDLVEAVVTPGGNPIGRRAAEVTDALVDSPSVLDALLGMIDTDYRSALRTIVSGGNPQMDEDEKRERVDRVVEYTPQEVGAARLRAWIDDRVLEGSRAIGGKLWILTFGSNEWFPDAAMDKTRELIPEAHIEAVEDGPVSRPDITANAIRRITSAAGVGHEAENEKSRA
jgi:pimeloyl-ACP methyl ester carboxylesterase